jgi:hypothetical protein
MTKNAIKIGFQNGHLTMALDEHEIFFEEWIDRRKKAFSELRKNDSFIPAELIDLVENAKGQTPVRLCPIPVRDESCPESSTVGLRFGVKVIGPKPKQDVAAGNAETEENADEITAAEALAFFLRTLLRDLKVAEKESGAAPVRVGKLCSRSLIGQIAFDLLESCECWNYSPGPELVQLVGELLDQRSYKQGASREFDAREQAISIIAQRPDVGGRELAKEVKVNVSTVSRWRKDPDFNERVKRKTEWNKSGAKLRPPKSTA